MKKKDVARIVAILSGNFSDKFRNMNDDQMAAFVEIWSKSFEDNSLFEIETAVMDYIQNSADGFMPTVGQIKKIIAAYKFSSVPNEMEAFQILIDARGRYDFYGSGGQEDEYEKLSDAIKKSIGGKRGFIDIGKLNIESESFSVEKTNFMRAYRAEIEREKTENNRPKWLKGAIEKIKKSERYNELSEQEKKLLN